MKTIPEPYFKICMLENFSNISLSNKRNYTLLLSVGLPTYKMRPVQCILHSGAEPILIREDLLETDWFQIIRPVSAPSSQCATTQDVSIIGTVLLHVRMGDARFRMVYGAGRDLSVSIFLGISFIDRFFNGIYRPEHKFSLYNYASVPIIAIVIKTEEEIYQNKQERISFKNVTVVEEGHNFHRLYGR